MNEKKRGVPWTEILDKIKHLKKDQWMIIILIGVLLFVISLPVKNSEKEQQKEKVNGYEESAGENDGLESGSTREELLEKRLENLLSAMDGVGKVQVMISLEGSTEYVVEKDSQESRTETKEGEGENQRNGVEVQLQRETVFVEQEGETTPYVVQELYPKIEGVVVLAEGGGNAQVAEHISKAVQALFSIETHKIMVMKMEYSGG